MLRRIAQEAAVAFGGCAEVVRFDHEPPVSVAAWPAAARRLGTAPIHLSTGRDAYSVGRHLVAPVVVDRTCRGALVAHNAAGDGAGALEQLTGLTPLCVANGDAAPANRARGPIERDDVTGVAGHPAFRERLAHEYRKAAPAGSGLSLVLLECRPESGRQFWPDAVSALELFYEAGALLLQAAPPSSDTANRSARSTELAETPRRGPRARRYTACSCLAVS